MKAGPSSTFENTDFRRARALANATKMAPKKDLITLQHFRAAFRRNFCWKFSKRN